MANGSYDIEVLRPNGKWRKDLRMQMMGKDFAKGAFFCLKSLNGGSIDYRLVKREKDGSVTELDRHSTGRIHLA